MSRRRRAVKRVILPDPKYGNVLATRFINCMMQRGKKSVAEKTFYEAVEMVTQRSEEQLLVPETLLKRRLEFIRGEYDPDDAKRGGAS